MPDADAAPPLTIAFHAILRSIRARKLLLRGLTLAMATLIIAAPLASLWHARALLLLLLLFPLWFGYLVADAAILASWRRGLLRSWCAGQINVGVLRGAVQGLPMIPQATLATMWATLPDTDPLQDAALSVAERDALALQSSRRWRRRLATSLLPSLASAVAALGTMFALSCIMDAA
jgi:hypothetical protein